MLGKTPSLKERERWDKAAYEETLGYIKNTLETINYS